MDAALQVWAGGLTCSALAVKDPQPRPRKPAGPGRRADEADSQIDDEIAQTRARLEQLLGRGPAEATRESEKIDFRARRFRPKQELAEPGAEAPDPGQREIAPPPPRESIPPEFQSAPAAQGGDAEPKAAPYWSDPEGESRPAWDGRNELRRIPAGL